METLRLRRFLGVPPASLVTGISLLHGKPRKVILERERECEGVEEEGTRAFWAMGQGLSSCLYIGGGVP
ncbi:hypothetical protein M5K25_024024 [Dendrobium thyrsiflorum]|uniref:Uncharacterized protein n=1 Tax=Dendrobium thyrsiflorum TaxID=117978 RepID=A0ABD0U154_DENTH